MKHVCLRITCTFQPTAKFREATWKLFPPWHKPMRVFPLVLSQLTTIGGCGSQTYGQIDLHIPTPSNRVF